MIFLPTFLDSSNFWNTDHNQLQLQQIGTNTHSSTTPSPGGPDDGGCNNRNQEGFMATARAGSGAEGGCDDGCWDVGDGDGGGSGNSKPTSMSEQARLARVQKPVSGLNCPRCDSTNTKFCYFNNYSLTQPRHFCRACRRYWTHGGALRNVPVGRGYRRHAKSSIKPKAASAASRAAAAGTTSSSTTCTPASAGLQYSLYGSAPSPGSLFADSFDWENLGLSYPARLLYADIGGYTADGCAQQHANGNEMEHWAAAQLDSLSFPFMHTMDNEMYGLPAKEMPITMAAMQGMVHLGLESVSGANDDDGGGYQLYHPPAKRDQQQLDYSNNRGMYGDVVNGNGGGRYN